MKACCSENIYFTIIDCMLLCVCEELSVCECLCVHDVQVDEEIHITNSLHIRHLDMILLQPFTFLRTFLII